MLVECITNNAGAFPEELFQIGLNARSEFNLKIGKEYMVFGINVWRGMTSYLLIGEEVETPSWYPSPAFEIVENSIPSNWFFNTFRKDQKNGLQILLGYEELVNHIEDNYDALIERDVEALKTFYSRKYEIEREYQK